MGQRIQEDIVYHNLDLGVKVTETSPKGFPSLEAYLCQISHFYYKLFSFGSKHFWLLQATMEPFFV